MAITVNFYTFAKAVNSTKQPSGSGETFECSLISPCSIVSPVIQIASEFNPAQYNYAEIPEFNRYYWVRNWTWSRGLWQAQLESDPLASYKDQIGDLTEYVLRSAAESNGDITDKAYPTTAAITQVQTPIAPAPVFAQSLVNGCYVVGIVGKGPGLQMGASTYYLFPPVGFDEFAKVLFGEDSWLELEGSEVPVFDGSGAVLKEVPTNVTQLKTQFNPLQYITSVTWFPFYEAGLGPAFSGVQLGWWTINAGGGQIPQKPYEKSWTITCPTHPQQPTRGYYLNLPPYSRYTLHFKPFGDIPLDGTYFVKDAAITVSVKVDLISGEAVLSVSSPSNGGRPFVTARAKVGVSISVGQLASQGFSRGVSALAGVGGGIADILTGDFAGAISNGVSAVGDAWSACLPQVSTTGANGSVAEYGEIPYLTSQFFPVVDQDMEHLGAPLCSKRQLSSLAGYQQIYQPEGRVSATQEEMTKIIDALRGGYYYE